VAEFARGFRLHLRHGQVLDGAAFPSGRCLVIDDPQFGLASVAASEEDLLRGYAGSRIEWPDSEGTALTFAGLSRSAETDVTAVHQLAESWSTQPNRYAPLQELLAALAAARTS
jgi:hypothetical protein